MVRYLIFLSLRFRTHLLLLGVDPSGGEVRSQSGFRRESMLRAAIALEDESGQFVLQDRHLVTFGVVDM